MTSRPEAAVFAFFPAEVEKFSSFLGHIFREEDSRLLAWDLLPGFHEFSFGVIVFELDDYLSGVISVCNQCS